VRIVVVVIDLDLAVLDRGEELGGLRKPSSPESIVSDRKPILSGEGGDLRRSVTAIVRRNPKSASYQFLYESTRSSRGRGASWRESRKGH